MTLIPPPTDNLSLRKNHQCPSVDDLIIPANDFIRCAALKSFVAIIHKVLFGVKGAVNVKNFECVLLTLV